MNPLFAQLTALLASQATSVEAANAFDAAYEGGKYHSEDFGADSTNVAPNLAGYYATVNAALAISHLRSASYDGVADVLTEMANRELAGHELEIAMLFANATWAAGQWARSPARVERIRCFASLPESERLKDVDQLAAGATFLLNKLSIS